VKKITLGIFLLFGLGAFAQELPRTEVYLGYSFTRVNSAINVPAFSANGGLGEIAFNLNRWLAAVGSFNAVHNGNINDFHVDQTAFGYHFGPRVNLRFGRITPFGEGLFGATHDSRSFRSPVQITVVGVNGSVSTISTRFVNSDTAFSLLAGGGLDYAMSNHLSLRPIKLDYYLTRFQPIFISGLGNFNRNRNQNNLLYSAGVNFRF
jgi:opacity protein-like surface antigen